MSANCNHLGVMELLIGFAPIFELYESPVSLSTLEKHIITGWPIIVKLRDFKIPLSPLGSPHLIGMGDRSTLAT